MIPQNKKIAILHPRVDKKGGAVHMMILLGNLLKKRGNQVEFFTTSYDENLFGKDIDFKVSVFSKIKIAYLIRKSDYIIAGNSPMQFVGVLSKLLFLSHSKIFWWHHHYPWYYEKHTNTFIFLKRILEKFSILFIDSFIANSYFIQNALKQIYGVDAQILYPVLDTYFLEYTPKEKDFSTPTLISYGRWVEGKNLKQIFQTYKQLQAKIPKLELLLGGVGEDLAFYKKQYASDTHIKFLGMLDKKSIVDNLEQSNVFLFPSQVDSFGISALEALSVGVPVVGFSGKGLTELVQNGKNGFIVDTETEFTAKTFEILSNKSLNKQLSKYAIKSIDQFTLSTYIQNLEKIFS